MPPRGDPATVGRRKSQECAHGRGAPLPLLPVILCFLTASWQNLRDEVTMDVDEGEEEGDSTERLRKVPDYGIEVDFDIPSGNEREVSPFDSTCFYDIPRCPFLLMGRLAST